MVLPRVVHYAHHGGSGHVRHARRFAELGLAEVTVVGTTVGSLAGAADVRVLPPDDAGDHSQAPESLLHWTPRDDLTRERFSVFHAVLDDVRPDLVIVDVSVEAALFARLAGYRVVHRRMPGRRDDVAHRLVYAESEALFAFHPLVLDPGFEFADKTVSLGLPDPGLPDGLAEPGAVVVLGGFGGASVTAGALADAAAAPPDLTFHVLGPVEADGLPSSVHLHGAVDDVRPWLARADVIVTTAGTNALADAAAARRPVVVVPEPRPFDEQEMLAAALADVAQVVVAQPGAAWSEIVEDARDRGGDVLAAALLVSPTTHRARSATLLERALS